MTAQIKLRPDELRLVRSIVATYLPGYDVRVFGSRVAGNVKPASDLDLCIIDEPALPTETLLQLQDAFSESQVPFKVDVSCYSKLTGSLRRVIEEASVSIRDAIST